MDKTNLIWTKSSYAKFKKYLITQKKSDDFIEFSKKLIFTKYEFIGITIPNLRKIAKEISKTDIRSFLDIEKKTTYEEIMLEGFAISYIKDYQLFLSYFNQFIKKIDNWAICDSCVNSMKIITHYKDDFFSEIKKYLNSNEEFIVRIGIVFLLNYYLDDMYVDEVLNLIDQIKQDQYYINMAIAWLISECFIKYKAKIYKYLKNNKLNKFAYNKAIQKILESRKVSLSDKQKLRRQKSNI